MLLHKTKFSAVVVHHPEEGEFHGTILREGTRNFEIKQLPNFMWAAVDLRQAHEERKRK